MKKSNRIAKNNGISPTSTQVKHPSQKLGKPPEDSLKAKPPVQPGEFERFCAVFEEEIASRVEFGGRIKIMKRGCFFYQVWEGVCVKINGVFRCTEEIEDLHGADHLEKLLRELPPSDIMRPAEFEPMTRAEVLDWIGVYVLPRVVPKDLVADFWPQPFKGRPEAA